MLKSENTCSALIKQINDSLERSANNTLRADGLTMMQIAVLVALDTAEEKTLSLKHLEHAFGVAQPTMAGIVKRLEQKKLVDSFEPPEDRRRKLVRLTAAGSEKCDLGYSHMSHAEEHLLRALSEEERGEFHRLLEKIRESLDS